MQTLYFVATDGKAQLNGDPLLNFPQNFELWRLEPDGQAVVAADIIVGDAGSFPTFFTKFNNQLFFSAYTPNTGRELWKVGSDGAVSLAADLVPSSAGSNPFFHELDDESDYTTVVYNGELYFNASTPATGRELFKVKADGSVVLVADLLPGSNDSSPLFGNSNGHFIFNGEFYFDAEGAAGLNLWKVKTDGSVQAVPLPNGVALHADAEFTAFNGSMYFTGEMGGGQLLRVTPGGTVEQITTDALYPQYLTAFNNALYFQAFDTDHGVELWRLLPNNAVERVADINSGHQGKDSSGPSQLQVMAGALYFNAFSFDDVTFITSQSLWKLDAGGQLARVSDALLAGYEPITFNGVTYFLATDADHGTELWEVTPGGVGLAADINPGAHSSFNGPVEFVAFNGNLYFNAITDTRGQELWKIAANGAVSLVMDINPGPNSSHPFAIAAETGARVTEHAILNDELYFAAEDADGMQLWKIKADGSVVQATDIHNGAAGFFLNVLGDGSPQPGNSAPVVTGSVTLQAIPQDSGARLITQSELLANVSDADHDPLTATGLAVASGQGTLADNHDGTWSYTPAAGDNTAVSFSYSVSDGTESVGDGATLDILPAHSNAPPTVTGSVTLQAIPQDSGARLITQSELLANVSDADHDPLTATGLAIASGHGALADNHDGTWSYTPAEGDDASVTFSYSVSDGIVSGGDTATLDIVPTPATPPSTPGTPGDDTFQAGAGSSVFNAGLGIDTISFGFKLTDATVTYSGNRVIIDGPGGTHADLSGFEVFKFSDGTVNNNDGNPLVDDLFYYATYHDVWLAGADADLHYAVYGWHEGRNPDAFFDTAGYLAIYTDVKAAGVNPLDHYDLWGWKEGRDPSPAFDTRGYLALYPDINAAKVDPLAHFLLWGAQEGRAPVGDGHFG